MNNTTYCNFPGDDNLYGAGVRIGSYLQWLATIFAYSLAPERLVGRAGHSTIDIFH